jgi:prevent-host-death family protein
VTQTSALSQDISGQRGQLESNACIDRLSDFASRGAELLAFRAYVRSVRSATTKRNSPSSAVRKFGGHKATNKLEITAIMAKSHVDSHKGHTMQSMSAKDGKYGFGRLIDLARSEPIVVEKHGRPVVVVLAVEEFERLRDGANGAVSRSEKSSVRRTAKRRRAKRP